jgi:hypothetical protein
MDMEGHRPRMFLNRMFLNRMFRKTLGPKRVKVRGD